jgi:hypothetical protein
MATQTVGFMVWLTLMLLAIPYVRHAKHPRSHVVAAYMVFVVLFSLGAVVMYSVLLRVLIGFDAVDYLHHPLGALFFLALVFIPAFLLGRWQLKKPPRQMPLG